MKVAILGCGFMGSSFAAALRRRGLASRVVGYDSDGGRAQRALALGLLDGVAADASSALHGADLVVLAAPVGALPVLMAGITGALPVAALITDLGSTKQDVIAAARQALGAAFERFVPGHPIAGGERAGPEHADAELFQGRLVVTTPTARTRPDALERVEAVWRDCGARIERMDAALHDRVFAAVSHLPHVLAFTLVAHIAAQPDAQFMLELAGTGFRDLTRIAASNAVMWRDIALANRAALSVELRAFVDLLQQVEASLAAGDGPALEALFERACQARQRLDGGERGR